MEKRLYHTPEGTRDIYGTEYTEKLDIERKICENIGKYGFEQIQTPSFEYFDIFSKERGTVPSREMYKFVDRDGETLVLRPDMTPQIARCVAKYYKEDTMPIRLSYCGNTYVNYSGYCGRLKESTQIGAELMNDASVFADAEMVALMIESLFAAGITKLQVEIGQADFFRALTKEAQMTEEEVENLRLLISNKNIFGVEELLQQFNISEELKALFLQLPEVFGSFEQIIKLMDLTPNEEAKKALLRLEQLHHTLSLYGLEEYVTYDLGMLSKFNYYTGVIFRAYTYGTGEPIAAGGRYDALLSQFGKEAPAIGIAIYVDQLMLSLERQGLLPAKEKKLTVILFDEQNTEKAMERIKKLRSSGQCATMQKVDFAKIRDRAKAYAKSLHASELICMIENTELTDTIA